MLVTADTFDAAMDAISSVDRVAFDLETTGLLPFGKDVLVGVAIAVGLDSYYFPFRHGAGQNLPYDNLVSLLKLLVTKRWTTWNGKFDLKFMRKEYLRLGMNVYPPLCEDVMLASHLVDENQPNFKLKDTGDRFAQYLGYDPQGASVQQAKLDAYMMEKGLGHGDMWRVPGEIVAPYAEQDVVLTEQLRRFFIAPLQRWDLYDLWQELNDYLRVVADIEERGMFLDLSRIQHHIERSVEERDACLARLREVSGVPHLNPNSAKVFKSYLNIELMLQHGTSITGTDVDILEGLLDIVEPGGKLDTIIRESINYRRWVKVKGAYYEAFLHFQSKGILHPNLHMTGTVTGRFSCSEPNMQAIPRKEGEFRPGHLVKESFIARPGWWLVQIDYKMAEIFLGAHIAKAEHMIAMLRDGVDVHAATAKLINNIPRSIGKRLNFAVMYGIGDEKFVEDVKKMAGLDITLQEAHRYIGQYNEVHPEMRAMYRNLELEARTNGFIRLITGRVRRYNGHEYYSKDGYRGSPYQKASSNMVQGSVAEVMRIASTNIHHQLGNKAYQLLHVHDSIMFEIKEGDLETIRSVEKIMCMDEVAGNKLAVPLRVDIEVGHRWSDLQPLKQVVGAA